MVDSAEKIIGFKENGEKIDLSLDELVVALEEIDSDLAKIETGTDMGDVAQTSDSEDEKKRKRVKKIKRLLAESASAGVLTVLLALLGCRSPLPMVLLALNNTDLTEDECKQEARRVASGTVAGEFFAGAGGYALVRSISDRLRKNEDNPAD